MHHTASTLPLTSQLHDPEQVSHFPFWSLSFCNCTVGMTIIAFPDSKGSSSMGMNVLCELESCAHRSKAFHPNRQEGLNT